VTPSATTTYTVTASNTAGSTQASATVTVTGDPPPPATENFEGIWWAAPAGSESGWGINLSHQGDVIFATWFTYNASGNPYWLTMTATRTDPQSYVFAGDLYETQGPPYNAAPFDPRKVTSVRKGSGRLAFEDGNNGLFTWSIGGRTQDKAIVREIFASPAPHCTSGPATTLPTRKNYQGLWWAAPAGSEAGWGINLNHQGDIVFATWFTYGPDGAPMWLSATINLIGNAGTGTLYSTTGPAYTSSFFDAKTVTRSPAGTLSVNFSDGNTGTMTYMVAGSTQSKAITRQLFGSPVSLCS
jgi:hypothetical protein